MGDPDVVAALAEVLTRRCLDQTQPGDGSLAHDLGRRLAQAEREQELFAVGIVGAWAGFGPDEQLDQDTITPVVNAARELLRIDIAVEERALVCAALGLLAARGVTNLPGVDFLNVATSARRIDQHEMALWAARSALRFQQTLIPSHQVLALLTIAVITHEPAVIEEAYALAGTLGADDIARQSADTLAPTLRHPVGMTTVGKSVQRRDRRSAARVAYKSVHLNENTSAALRALVAASPAALAGLAIDAVADLATQFLPRALIERAKSGELTSLVVVPDADAWTIPWQIAPALAGVEVTLAPSLGVHARLPADPGPVESITAIVDEDAPYAELVSDALLDVRACGVDVRMPRSLDIVGGGDLLITFTHGGGTGLRFVAGSEALPLPAIALATKGFRRALIAACWSSAAPPVSYPLNLPAAMLVNGAATVIGGLWPLPAYDTAVIVAAAIRDIGTGSPIRDAVHRARLHAPGTVVSRWGLAVHGGPASP